MSSLFALTSTVSEMLRPGLVSTSVILSLLAIFTISQIDVSSARALGLNDDYWSSSKRNSWWSKKSLESAPDYQRLLQESAFEDPTIDITADRESLPPYTSLFRCYVRECVPKFVQCAQRTARQDEYAECKRQHELCGMICGASNIEESVI